MPHRCVVALPCAAVVVGLALLAPRLRRDRGRGPRQAQGSRRSDALPRRPGHRRADLRVHRAQGRCDEVRVDAQGPGSRVVRRRRQESRQALWRSDLGSRRRQQGRRRTQGARRRPRSERDPLAAAYRQDRRRAAACWPDGKHSALAHGRRQGARRTAAARRRRPARKSVSRTRPTMSSIRRSHDRTRPQRKTHGRLPDRQRRNHRTGRL